ncbi:hypothetical protein CANCADRAFT_30882 [Tortispora caseinolytica NRRL Y-17796]|uniref:Cytochrome P450 n=1 Tax=Tortispora caseinolytica NRRL Y-17796 TaxID=767744 RepID=A0A1E4TM94_9ASCO|nr:hypothetical protein CANCADRAFT_30882 [Tortispora caseinolytica NRRL Y-17796]
MSQGSHFISKIPYFALVSLLAGYWSTITAAQHGTNISFAAVAILVYCLLFFLYTLFCLFVYPFVFSKFRGKYPLLFDDYSFLLGHVKMFLSGNCKDRYAEFIAKHPDAKAALFYGPLMTERLVVFDPLTLKELLVRYSYSFPKPSEVQETLNIGFGDGLFLSEGSYHQHLRKIMMPMFTLQHVRNIAPTFWENAKELVDLWDHKISIGADEKGILKYDTMDDFYNVAFDNICNAGLGVDLDALHDPGNETFNAYCQLFVPPRSWFDALTTFLTFFWSRFFYYSWKIPIHSRTQVSRSRAKIMKLIENIVNQRRIKLRLEEKDTNAQVDDKDLVSIILRTNRHSFTTDEMVNNLMSFLAAGHETISSSLLWTLYLLSRNPEVQASLRAAIYDKLPQLFIGSDAQPMSNEAMLEALENITELEQVMLEQMRVLPSVPQTLRIALKDHIFDSGIYVSKDTEIIVPLIGITTNPAIWGKDSYDFRPGRWTEQLIKGKNSTQTYMPFLAGPRMCIGKRFAETEYKITLATLIARFQFGPVNEYKLVYDARITSRPANGMPLLISAVENYSP